MRLLPERHDHRCSGTAGQKPKSYPVANQRRLHEQAPVPASLPLRHLCGHHRCGAARCEKHERLKEVRALAGQPDHLRGSSITPTLTRRGFVKLGGALMVFFQFPALSAMAADDKPASTTTHLVSWL